MDHGITAAHTLRPRAVETARTVVHRARSAATLSHPQQARRKSAIIPCPDVASGIESPTLKWALLAQAL